MLASQIPTKFPIPFGNNAAAGTIRPVPQASQVSVSPGNASLTDGFPVATGQPLASGGVPPAMQDFNGLFNQITAWSRWQNAGGTVGFDQSFCTAIGGYPQGAVLASTTAGLLWLSLVDNNTTNPDGTGASGWVSILTSATASAQTVVQAAKAVFNAQQFNTSVRAPLSQQGAGAVAVGWTGFSYTKSSSTSLILVWAEFMCRTAGANGPTLFHLNFGSNAYEVTASNAVPGTAIKNTIVRTLGTKTSPLAKATYNCSLDFYRNDSTAWTTVFNPSNADESGYTSTPVATLIFAEVEPT
jgi:hypothetical protein